MVLLLVSALVDGYPLLCKSNPLSKLVFRFVSGTNDYHFTLRKRFQKIHTPNVISPNIIHMSVCCASIEQDTKFGKILRKTLPIFSMLVLGRW